MIADVTKGLRALPLFAKRRNVSTQSTAAAAAAEEGVLLSR
jgi:hypothetical protein